MEDPSWPFLSLILAVIRRGARDFDLAQFPLQSPTLLLGDLRVLMAG
jgi:hypothetical protein